MRTRKCEKDNKQAKKIYEMKKKIRDERNSLKNQHEEDCESMLFNILNEDVNNSKTK